MARVPISLVLLAQALRLPTDARIERVDMHPEQRDVVVLFVAHPDLPVVKPGDVIPRVDLVMHEPVVAELASEWQF